MKKFGMLALLGGIFITSTTFAETLDTQLEEQMQGAEKVSADKFKFHQMESCESLETMLEKYAKKYQADRGRDIIYNGLFGYKTVSKNMNMIEDVDYATDDVAVAESAVMKESLGVQTASTEYSTTNLQKIGVDEPEILKTDGKYYYYYNDKTDKVIILRSPLNIEKKTINADQVEIVKEIKIPRDLNDIELFVTNNRLVILGRNYNGNEGFFGSERSIIAIYDVSSIENLKLIRFENIPGSYRDSRVIGDELYVISEMGYNWYYRDRVQKDLKSGLRNIGITENGVQISNIDCNQISYVLPDDEDLKLSPRFTIVSKINIQKIDTKVDTTALLSPEGELHMTQNALYLVSSYYTPRTFYCPLGMFCTYGYYRGGTTQTLVHKFALENTNLVYKNSSLIGGTMLNQYSMDEDSKGNFRILTESNGTNLYVFDHNFELAGKLEGIEPDEEFKSSRYIEDKLYLVTWHEIDPLFVIDLENPKNPQILGELEIPGYSKYLHPLKKEGSKQYLIGLGYNTADNGRGGYVNSGLKISLFEIDYAKKEKNQIAISEIANYSTGGNGSYSSVLENPRLFVMNSKGEVTLPMTISTTIENGENCNVTYDKEGKETGRNCYPIKKTEYFRGLKSFAISPENGIKEIFTKDYATGTIAEKIGRNTRYLERMRVGFAGDVLFTINDLFADFIFPNEEEGATVFFK